MLNIREILQLKCKKMQNTAIKEMGGTMMDIKMLKLTDIKPYEKNPRKNDTAVDVVASSIREFGFKTPIVVDKNMEIINGHTRYKAATKLGLEEVPVIIASDLTPAQVKAYRIMDNKSSEFAEWDYDMLMTEIKGLQKDYAVSELEDVVGFTPKDIEDIAREFSIPLTDTEYSADTDKKKEISETITQAGDIWMLGKHKVICGSLEDLKLKDLLDGRKLNLLVTELMEVEEGTNQYQYFYKALKQVYDNIIDGGNIYISSDKYDDIDFLNACKSVGFKISSMCCWKTPVKDFGRQYRKAHELVYYGWKETAQHLWNSDRKQSTLWEFAESDYTKETKPVEMIEYIINNGSKFGDLVVDINAGYGTTLIASEITGRECILIEKDAEKIDHIVHRYMTIKKSDGEDVKLIRNGNEVSL